MVISIDVSRMPRVYGFERRRYCYYSLFRSSSSLALCDRTWSIQSEGICISSRSGLEAPYGLMTRFNMTGLGESGGKFALVAPSPRIILRRTSYTTAASSGVANVPSHSLEPDCGLRISEAYVPHFLIRTPTYLHDLVLVRLEG